MNDDNCPMGTACAIHFRNDEDTVDKPGFAPRLITYVGRYAVVTDQSPDVLRMIFGPEYDTTVLIVGDGVLADLHGVDPKEQDKYELLQQSHDEPENFRNAHEMVVDGIRSGMLQGDAD